MFEVLEKHLLLDCLDIHSVVICSSTIQLRKFDCLIYTSCVCSVIKTTKTTTSIAQDYFYGGNSTSTQCSVEELTCYRAGLSPGFCPSPSCCKPPGAFWSPPPDSDLPSPLHPSPAPPAHAPWDKDSVRFYGAPLVGLRVSCSGLQIQWYC